MNDDHDRAAIRVSFDAMQIGGNLVWHIDDDKQRDLFQRFGRHAGSVHFDPDDEIYVEVYGFGPEAIFLDAKVLQAALITRPHTSQERYSEPSPWDPLGAVAALADWTDTGAIVDPATSLRETMQSTKTPLRIVVAEGRWELSLIVTIALTFQGDAGKETSVRVFGFDPESEVGTGADPKRHPIVVTRNG